MSEREPHVPLIDISQDDSTASQQLFDALTTSGFACLTNTGLWEMVRTKNRHSLMLKVTVW